MLTHEEYENIFDATAMFLGLLALSIFHPGHIVQCPDSSFPKLSGADKERFKAQKKPLKWQRREGNMMDLKGDSFLGRPDKISKMIQCCGKIDSLAQRMEVGWSLLRCMGYKELMSQCSVDYKSLLLATVKKKAIAPSLLVD